MKSKLALVMFPLCAVIFMVTVVVMPTQTYAQSIIAGLPFGGKVVGPAIYPFAFPACPYHIMVVKLNTDPITQPRLLGIIPGPGSRIYENFNLITPGVWLLGTYAPPVFLPPVCPYPVGNLIQVGTSLIPGI